MAEVIHEEGNFIWTVCETCQRLLGIRRWLVKSKKPGYRLTIEDAHRIYELTPALFHPKKYFHYEEAHEPGSWHIIPKYPGEDDDAE